MKRYRFEEVVDGVLAAILADRLAGHPGDGGRAESEAAVKGPDRESTRQAA